MKYWIIDRQTFEITIIAEIYWLNVVWTVTEGEPVMCFKNVFYHLRLDIFAIQQEALWQKKVADKKYL